MPRSRSLRAIVLLTLAVGTSACQRGCLMEWLEEHGASPGPAGEGTSARRAPSSRHAGPSFDLGGTDCSDGLARCVDGRIETSVAGHVPYPCTASRERPGSCDCAWAPAATCEAGCVKDGIEVIASADVARAQLCASPASPASPSPVLRPLSPTELSNVPICADESASCVDGVVRACAARGQPARLVGACAHGCASGIGAEPGDLLTSDGAAAILCRRAHAERR